MAIQINGNGTITGISVGGLPDGIVDTDMIANNAVTDAKSTIVGGKILQVIENTSSTTVTTTAGSSNDADLISLSITPSSASNKVLLFVTFSGQAVPSTNSKINVRLYRGTSSSGTLILDLKQGSNDAEYRSVHCSGSKLDSPNTTSAQTYTVAIRRLSSGTNYVSSDGNPYHIQAMEVAA